MPDSFGENFHPGYNFGVGYVHYFTSSLAVHTCFDYNSFSIDEDEVLNKVGLNKSSIDISEVIINIINISINFQYNFMDIKQKISPYIFVGSGFFHVSTEFLYATDVYYSEDLDKGLKGTIFMNIGLGSKIDIYKNFSLFCDARFLIGFNEYKNIFYIPVRIGGLIWL